MTGLPCTVAAVLVVALLGTVADSAYVCETPESPKVSQIPEKCFNEVSTGSEMSNEERQSAVNAVNLYRGFITNQCDKFKSGKPKSANFRKIRYSCDLEKQVKFTCPAKANDAFTTSGTVFRRVDIVYETSFFYRAAPWLHEIDINGQTLDFVDNSVRLSETMRFYLNGNAGEIGCYLKKCHGKEYVACTTGTTIPTSGPLYTPGTRCRSNNDCLDTGYPICDTEFGLCKQGGSPVTTTTKKPTTTPTTRKPGQGCQKDADCTASTLHVCNLQTGVCGPLTCKFNDSSLTVDPCSEVLFCHVLPDLGAGSQQHVCRNYIIIAERNIDHTFTVKGFGAAVSKTHFLSSVSSGFAKYGNSELYVIVAGYGIHQLRAADVFPQMNIGSFNVNAWQDLVLVKLPAGTTLVFHFEVKKTAPGPQDKLTTLRLSGDKLNLGAIQLQPDAECEKMFRLDETIQYVPNSNMACGLDANDRGTRLMNGAPLAVGTYVYGIRSVASLDPGHKNGFLVTKLAPNCDWLFRASEGAVKCV